MKKNRNYHPPQNTAPTQKRKGLWFKILLVVLALFFIIGFGLAIYINNLLNKINFEPEVEEVLPPEVQTVTTDDIGLLPIDLDEAPTETYEVPSSTASKGDDFEIIYETDFTDYMPTSVRTTMSQTETEAPETTVVTEPTTTSSQTTQENTFSKDQIEEAVEEAKENVEEPAPQPVLNNSDVEHILLIGVDSRDGSIYGRSDAMILASMNHKSKKLTFTSFMRDTLVQIPGKGYSRMGHANSFGGPNLLLKTVEANFKIPVSKYMLVNFTNMTRIVDALGGVDISVTASELAIIRSEAGSRPETQSAGTIRLNGREALAYSRIRMIGTDFARTSRQRIVLQAMMQRISGLSLTEMMDFASDVLPLLTTNMSRSEILGYVGRAPAILGYSQQQGRIPIDSSFRHGYYQGMEILLLDFGKNINRLISLIY